MVFKRRDKRALWQIVLEFFYPRGGWTRAAHYVKHRLRRLPDPPERIARGLFAGVVTCFTPFFGVHFVIAGVLAWIMRGNLLAALLGTFFGNPLTYVPIGVISIQTGYWLLGLKRPDAVLHGTLGAKFVKAGSDLCHNLLALFTHAEADWRGLSIFYNEVFFPYLIGGLIPGIVTGLIVYYLSVPVLRAYQNRRRGLIKAKLERLKKKAKSAADASRKQE